MEAPKTDAQLQNNKPMTRGEALDLLCKKVLSIVVGADPVLAKSPSLQKFWDMDQGERITELISISSKVVFFGQFKGGLDKILNSMSALRGMVVFLAGSLAKDSETVIDSETGREVRFDPNTLQESHWEDLQKVLLGWHQYFQKEFLDVLEQEKGMVSSEELSEFDQKAQDILQQATAALKLKQKEEELEAKNE